MKPSHKIFFAIPFDSATKQLYERVAEGLRQRYKTLTTIIGTEEIGPSPSYSSIATFKAQNRELTEQFFKRIRDADVVVADLTHNNPNVHVELGIALFENKNILRVTGRSVTELGFDIRNLEALRGALRRTNPDVVVHMAAQSLVRRSYRAKHWAAPQGV